MVAHRRISPRRACLSAVIAASCLLGQYAAAASEPNPGAAVVGHVSLLIGEASVVRANGSRVALQRGGDIMVGDRVETSANGHVHVRFIDNAAVSVRPESVLEVQTYRYDAQRPQANEVRLKVEQGTSRSISGAATEADKNRFRLNTPIAAIGVRGTDFIVQTDAHGARATVSSGSIVVGAIGGDCLAAALGPCGGGESRLLSAEMGRMMVEVRSGDRVARIVPATGSLLTSVAGNADERLAARSAAESAARSAGLQAAEPSQAALHRGNDKAAAELLTIAAVKVPDLNRPSDATGQLIWGRWSIGAESGDKISIPYSIASYQRHVTVADNAAGLFRTDDPSNPGRLLSDGLEATVDLRLKRAQASFEIDRRTESASVDGGTLKLDFAQRTFVTALALSSATAGKAQLRMGGDVRADGTFSVRDNDQRIAGAVTFDGREAGYLFERSAAGGMFRGKTLWGN